MGITGLLPAIGYGRDIKLPALKGKSFVVDGHCFIHKACMINPARLVIHDDPKHIINYMVRLLAPFMKVASFLTLVFDGGFIAGKSDTLDKRRAARDENIAQATRLLEQGKQKEAFPYLMASVSFRSHHISMIAHELYKVYGSTGRFAIILSPYEADAQVCYIHHIGLADIVVTSDSDILLYDPSTVLFNYKDELGRLVTRKDVYESPNSLFKGFSHTAMVKACILSGCDYVPSLKGVGLKKAAKQMTDQSSMLAAIEALHKSGKKPMPLPEGFTYEQYVEGVIKAYLTFRNQVVFSPVTLSYVNINNVAACDECFLYIYGADFLGVKVSADECAMYASGYAGRRNQDVFPYILDLGINTIAEWPVHSGLMALHNHCIESGTIVEQVNMHAQFGPVVEPFISSEGVDPTILACEQCISSQHLSEKVAIVSP